MPTRKPLSYYVKLNYPFRAQIDPDDGSYFVDFPDLPGCLTGGDHLEDLPAMIKEATSVWLEVAYEQGYQIAEPTVLDLDEPSGKFNVRLPKPLHRAVSEGADAAGVSLNQYVVSLLARGDAHARIDERLARLEAALGGDGTATSARVAEERVEYTAREPVRKISRATARKKQSSKRSKAK